MPPTVHTQATSTRNHLQEVAAQKQKEVARVVEAYAHIGADVKTVGEAREGRAFWTAVLQGSVQQRTLLEAVQEGWLGGQAGRLGHPA